jgi:hypothetical protein
MDTPLTAWQEYKKKLGETRPWDILNPNVERSSEEEAERRMSICVECPSLLKLTNQCKECGCVMSLKTKLEKATCPLGKW